MTGVVHLVTVLLLPGVLWAVDPDGFDGTGAPWATMQDLAADTIGVEVTNTWHPDYAQHVLDLEYCEDTGELLFVSNLDNKIFIADPADGSYVGEIDRPAGLAGFGVAWDGDEYFINSWISGNIYHSDGGGTWSSYANPAGTGGRGLNCWDYYDPALLESFSSEPVYRLMVFDPDGSGQTVWDLPGISEQISGITGYDVGTDPVTGMPTGLIATCYDEHFFYFFNPGTPFQLWGVAPCPVTVLKSLGLASTGGCEFYWSYQATDGLYYVSEIYAPISGALESDTWGAIKSSF